MGLTLACFLTACTHGFFDDDDELDMQAPPPAVAAEAPPAGQQSAAADVLHGMLPPEGPKFMPLFSEQLNNPDDRIKRLEKVVQDMRNDLDTVMPTVTHVAVMEKEMTVVAPPSASMPAESVAPIPVAPVPAEAPPAPAAASALPASGGVPMPDLLAPKPVAPPVEAVAPSPPAPPVLGDAKMIRMADHSDMTRVVIDMTAAYNSGVTLQNNGKTLVVPMQQFNWMPAKSQDMNSAQLISGYRMADGNLYVDLMYPAQIKDRKVLVPSRDHKDYRTVIDLFSADVHKK